MDGAPHPRRQPARERRLCMGMTPVLVTALEPLHRMNGRLADRPLHLGLHPEQTPLIRGAITAAALMSAVPRTGKEP